MTRSFIIIVLLAIPFTTSAYSSSFAHIDSGYVSVDKNINVFYKRIGTGSQIILVSFHRYLFDYFSRLSSPERSIIFYDPRGRGRSSYIDDSTKLSIKLDIEDIEKVRTHFTANPVSLLGFSEWGRVSLLYAKKYSANVKRVVVIGAPPLIPGTKYESEYMPDFSTVIIDSLLVLKLMKLITSGFAQTNPVEFSILNWEVYSKPLLVYDSGFYNKFSKQHKEGFSNKNEWLQNINRYFKVRTKNDQAVELTWKSLKKLEIPVLIIHGRDDRNAPYGAGREWAIKLSNARLLTVFNACHLPWLESPEVVYSAVDRFLGGQWPETALSISSKQND